MPGGQGSLLALQDLARSFGERRSPSRERELCDLAGSLGTTALPLALRELVRVEPARRAWAGRLLLRVAADHRQRVIDALHAIGADPCLGGVGPQDDAKVTALALLGELGERVTTSADAASFRDAGAIQRRSLAELADLLTCAADVALAADLLVTQLEPEAMLELVDGLAQTAPARCGHLVDELLGRTELDAAMRSELRRVTASLALVTPTPLDEPARGKPRSLALRHPSGRRVVIVGRRDPVEPRSSGADPRWRLLCLLIDADGQLVEALHREGRDDDGAALTAAIADELVSPLLADGFAQEAARPSTLRSRVAQAARRTTARGGELPGAYFLGRDLLDLTHDHRAPTATPDPTSTMLGRAVDLLAAGEPERARPLFAHVVTRREDDEALAGLALCLLAAGELDGARVHLERAAAAAPTWALHAWNLAVVAHRQGRAAARYLALRRYAELASTLQTNDEQARVELARRLIADHEREVRLDHPGCDALVLARSAEPPARRARRRSTGAPRATKLSARPRRSAPPPSPARP